jgi:hypothetical protein
VAEEKKRAEERVRRAEELAQIERLKAEIARLETEKRRLEMAALGKTYTPDEYEAEADQNAPFVEPEPVRLVEHRASKAPSKLPPRFQSYNEEPDNDFAQPSNQGASGWDAEPDNSFAQPSNPAPRVTQPSNPAPRKSGWDDEPDNSFAQPSNQGASGWDAEPDNSFAQPSNSAPRVAQPSNPAPRKSGWDDEPDNSFAQPSNPPPRVAQPSNPAPRASGWDDEPVNQFDTSSNQQPRSSGWDDEPSSNQQPRASLWDDVPDNDYGAERAGASVGRYTDESPFTNAQVSRQPIGCCSGLFVSCSRWFGWEGKSRILLMPYYKAQGLCALHRLQAMNTANSWPNTPHMQLYFFSKEKLFDSDTNPFF